MARIVRYAADVEEFLDEFMLILFEKGYFGFPDSAKEYKDKLTFYIEKYIGIVNGKDAPDYFSRYGKKLQYITYQPNNNTTWYILFQQFENIFLVRYITNNHVPAAKYFNI
ncbi:MAG: hypothetical protein LBN95_10560 [Prevotellaceae bacterium]|jgi:hypothetical protein|nr:hypothetical protein [Prevotellaceae bacterium]